VDDRPGSGDGLRQRRGRRPPAPPALQDPVVPAPSGIAAPRSTPRAAGRLVTSGAIAALAAHAVGRGMPSMKRARAPHQIAGSPEAKAHMALLRAKRIKK
jgi:hypothetical protein